MVQFFLGREMVEDESGGSRAKEKEKRKRWVGPSVCLQVY
jgi:hypothetical protein